MSMNRTNLRRVKSLCKEVLALIAEVDKEIENYSKELNFEVNSPPASKTTGELRRRSMDLTRALADLRR